MQRARMIGNYVQHLSESQDVSIKELSVLMNCTEQKVYAFFKGRAFASFPQIESISKRLGVSVQQIFVGDENIYDSTVVYCMNDFQEKNNREMILDIIDDYIDIKDAVEE